MPQINRRQFVIAGSAALCAGICGCAGDGGPAGDGWSGPTRFDVGPVAAIQAGVDSRYAKSGGFFLVREAGQIMAISAICSHKRCALAFKAQELICDCHGSTFTPGGVVETGPAVRSLPRFGISVDATGHAIVDRSAIYEETRWREPGAALAV